jgi:hypothetical protein
VEKILNIYCERGGDPGFWGEPLNAITNGAFLIAGFLLIRSARQDRTMLSWLLTLLVILIGVGSFLFHTFAERWAGLADVIPIGFFMVAAVYAITRRGLGGSFLVGALAIIGFIALMVLASRFGHLVTPQLGATIMYLPAFFVLIVSGAYLALARRPGGLALVTAGLVFGTSLTMRAVDLPYCDYLTIEGLRIGSHFLWHLLNGVTLYLVTAVLIRLSPHTTAGRTAVSLRDITE